ncbi:hypothetical protein [Sneathiella limimaris]|uniref:hypothetical protein n=1 Tax=Sneathiella limimaris TaxID=1964213 RepID=UPI00146F463C|nr:hypothetical protein [Sneathiella limimaris]
MKRLIPACLGSLLMLSATAQAGDIYSTLTPYKAEDCKPVVDDYLEKHSIDLDKITRTEYVTNYVNGSDHGEVKEYEAWTSFSTCTGNLVIRMNEACFIQADYATSECKSKGLPKR